MNASSGSSLAVVQFLLSQGADANIRNKAGSLAEDYARFEPALAMALLGKLAHQVRPFLQHFALSFLLVFFGFFLGSILFASCPPAKKKKKKKTQEEKIRRSVLPEIYKARPNLKIQFF